MPSFLSFINLLCLGKTLSQNDKFIKVEITLQCFFSKGNKFHLSIFACIHCKSFLMKRGAARCIECRLEDVLTFEQ